jgi:hypothetical protein
MGRKLNVIGDELNHKGHGMYCIYPFENLDKNGKGAFKIGMTVNSFQKRIDQYHTYFPQGVYIIAILENPPLNTKLLRSKKKIDSLKSLYLRIEAFIIKNIIDKGGILIYSTARVLKKNEFNEGRTEYIYTDDLTIHEVFLQARKRFGGELDIFTTNEIKKDKIKKPLFIGNVSFK